MSMNPQNGKGSGDRPMQVSREQFGENHDRIFKKKPDKPRKTEGFVFDNQLGHIRKSW